jgi:hypothetical protein
MDITKDRPDFQPHKEDHSTPICKVIFYQELKKTIMKVTSYFTISSVLILSLILSTCSTAVASTVEPEKTGLREIQVEHVQMEVGVGSPFPVNVLVSSTWPDLCSQLAETRQTLTDKTITITLQTGPADPDCPPDHLGLPFAIALPLNMVELPAGGYTISVNGTSTNFDWQQGGTTPTVPMMDPAVIDQVEVEIGVGSPIPVSVNVSGNFPDTCAQVREVTQELTEDEIWITILTTTPKEGEACIQDSLPFRMSIPLNIVNLPDGEYNVFVNGVGATFNVGS